MKTKSVIAKLKAQGYEVTKKKSTITDAVKIAKQRASSEEWFKSHLGLTVVERNLSVNLVTKQGVKQYEAVKLSNGKTAVYLKNGFLKYAW